MLKRVRTGLEAERQALQGLLTQGTYSHETGTLRYERYVPAAPAKRPPLFVMLHGCSQTAADFAAGTRMNDLADECGGIVLYPEQSSRGHVMGCWNWYEARHQGPDAGEPLLIAGLTRQVMAECGVDPARVYVAGMSAGGAMAVILGQGYPDLYAAIGVHSGLPSGAARDAMSAFTVMSQGPGPLADDERCVALAGNGASLAAIASIVFHGDLDDTVHPSNGEAVHAQTRGSVPLLPMPKRAVPSGTTPHTVAGGREVTRVVRAKRAGSPGGELWIVHGSGHAWTGGSADGSFTDEAGPDASREMVRFFLTQKLTTRPRRKASA